MKCLKDTYKISQRNLLNIPRKPMKYLKETYKISEGNKSYMSTTRHICQLLIIYVKYSSNVSRKLIIFVKETHHICQGCT